MGNTSIHLLFGHKYSDHKCFWDGAVIKHASLIPHRAFCPFRLRMLVSLGNVSCCQETFHKLLSCWARPVPHAACSQHCRQHYFAGTTRTFSKSSPWGVSPSVVVSAGVVEHCSSRKLSLFWSLMIVEAEMHVSLGEGNLHTHVAASRNGWK